MREYLEALTIVALLGTERRQLPAAPTGLGTLSQSSPEAELLTKAATVNLYQKAARMTETTVRLQQEVAVEDAKPAINRVAIAMLQQMVSGHYKGLLPEFLRLVAQSGQRLPHVILPQLLEMAHYDTSLRKAFLAVTTPRAIWLGHQNSAWRYVLAANNSPERFALGKLTERIAALREMRRQDPQQAREALIDTWKKDVAKDRAALIVALEVGLSLADEDFLEAALDDKSKLVRKEAADLLARLPNSAYVQRMIQRAVPLLNIQRGLLKRRVTVTLNLPASLDDAAPRDGIALENPPKGLGKKAWLFRQVLARTPLDVWKQHAEISKLLDACAEEDRGLLFTSWVTACDFNPNADDAWALLNYIPSVDAIPTLAPLLTPVQIDELAVTLLHRERMLTRAHVALLVMQAGVPQWGARLQKALAEAIKHSLARWENAWQARQVLETLAIYVPVEMLPQLRILKPAADDDKLVFPYMEFLSKVEFRQKMKESLLGR